MSNNSINTVGRGPAIIEAEDAIEAWKCFAGMIKESFASVDKAYDPVQEMLTKEHEMCLEMMGDSECPEKIRKEASRHVRETREAAQMMAPSRMADSLKIIGAYVTIIVAALGGTQYIKFVGK